MLGLSSNTEGTYLEILLFAVSLMLLLTFCVASLVAKRHGTRSSRPQSSGYELANQDDFNQELLADEDDFEVSEPTENTEQA